MGHTVGVQTRVATLAASAVALIALTLVAAGGCKPKPPTDPPPTTDTTVAPTTAPTTAAPPVDPALALCLQAQAVTPAPPVADAGLVEISGVAASRAHPDVLWVHNDSGGAAAVSAVSAADGSSLGTWSLADATNQDWEDIAIGPGPDGGDWLYVADIGDNLRRRTSVRVYRIPEPDPATGGGSVAHAEVLTLKYPDGFWDAEALLVDPVSGDLVIIQKALSGGPSHLYRAAGDLVDGSTTVLDAVGTTDLSAVGTLATGADISADGSLVAVRTYSKVVLWWRQPGQTVPEVLATVTPCAAPSATEAQGEAVALVDGTNGYVTISEGTNPPVNRYELPG